MTDTPKNRVQTHKGPLLVHIRAVLRAKLDGWDAEREIEKIVGCEISDTRDMLGYLASSCDTSADVEKLSDDNLLEAIEGMLSDPNTEIQPDGDD